MRFGIAAALIAAFTTGCGAGEEADLTAPVVTLARVEDWRAGLTKPFGHEHPFALLEIAYDRDTAERAWRQNVPADMPEQSGEPDDPGVYAPLDRVDFETHVVAVWSGGQSGDCASWIYDVTMPGERPTVSVTEHPGQDCLDEFNDYSLVLAIDRSRVPPPNRLPIYDAFEHSMTLDPSVEQPPDAVIDVYPATGWPADRPD